MKIYQQNYSSFTFDLQFSVALGVASNIWIELLSHFLQAYESAPFFTEFQSTLLYRHNDKKNFLVWINEEDHTRVISMEKGGNMRSVFERFCHGLNRVRDLVWPIALPWILWRSVVRIQGRIQEFHWEGGAKDYVRAAHISRAQGAKSLAARVRRAHCRALEALGF